MEAYDAIRRPFTAPLQLFIGASIVLLALLGAYALLPDYTYASLVLLAADIPILGYAITTASADEPEAWSVPHVTNGVTAVGVLLVHFIPVLFVQQLLRRYPPGSTTSWILGSLLLVLLVAVQYVLPYNMLATTFEWRPRFLLSLAYLKAILLAFGYTIAAGLLLYLVILVSYQLLLPWLLLAAVLGFAVPVTTFDLVHVAVEEDL